MNDLEAVKALRKGDKLAFKLLFEKYYDRLVAYITTYTFDADQSKDIVQQTFINFWNDRIKLDENRSPKAYLYSIAYNRYVDSFKKAKRRERTIDQVWENALRDRIEEDTEILEKRVEKMKQVIETLPPKCRKILQMNKVEGIKYKEIADQMGISVKTVESQMRIAFTKIREAFEKDNFMLILLFRRFQ